MAKFKYPTVYTSESKKDDVKEMSPKKYLKKARKLNIGEGDRKVINSFKKQIKAGDPLSPVKLLKHHHEDGRHRATAAKELGIDKIPVINERKKKAFGGALVDALNSDDPNMFMRRAINYAFAIAPLANKGRPGTGFFKGGEATLSSYEPTIGEKIYETIAGLSSEKPSPERRRFAEGISELAGLVPGIGNVMSAQEAQRAEKSGKYGEAALATLGALPIIGGAERKAAETAVDVAKRISSEIGRYEPSGSIHGYHLSPHEFEKFSTGAGTGTGAQVEGAGTYISSNPEGAKAWESLMPEGPKHLYEIHAPVDRTTFIDRNVPLSRQTEHVKSALEQFNIPSTISKWSEGASVDIPATGFDAYQHIRNQYGPEKASQMLSQAGISGMRYPGVGEGYNYLMYDPSSLNILNKSRQYKLGGRVKHALTGGVEFMPDDEAQAIDTAHDLNDGAFGESAAFIPPAPEPTPKVEAEKTYEPFGVLPFSEDKSGIHFDPHAGLLGHIISGLTLPGDVVTGQVDPKSEKGIERALDLAGVATSGSTFGTRPAGALASGASRPVQEALAGIGHNMPPEPTESIYQRLINPAGFYSHGHEVAMTQLPEGPRTWQEIQALLKKGNVKKEELSWAGLHPEAYEPTQKVTREEIADKFSRNFPQVGTTWKTQQTSQGSAMSPKWEQYTAPGGENYSESVLTLPYTKEGSDYIYPQIQNKYNDRLAQLEADVKAAESEIQQARDSSSKIAEKYKQDMEGPFIKNLKNKGISEEEANALFESSRPIDISYHLMDQDNYANLHDSARETVRSADSRLGEAVSKRGDLLKQMWEESDAFHPEYTREYFSHQGHLGNIDNPLLHQRWKERVGPEGERILSNEELQSDWAQQGREKGFKDPEAKKAHAELNRRKSDIDQEEMKEYSLNRKNFDEKADALIEKYNNDEAALDEKYLPRMTPEEIAEQKRLDTLLSREGGQALSDQEKMKYRYLNNKAHSIDRKNINYEHLIKQEYNLMAQPFVEEALAKNKEIDNNLSLSAFEKQKLKDEEEARYIEKIKPLDDWLRNAIQEHRQNLRKHEKELYELREAHDNAVSPHRDEFEARANEIERKYDELRKPIEEERAKLPKAGDIPLVPHVGSTEQWTELGVKHALQHALEQGHDQIFIMGGQEQARRYQNALRSAVDNIRWEQPGTVEYPTLSNLMGEPAITDDAFRTVYARPKDRRREKEHKFVIDKDGRVIDSNLSEAKGEKISTVVGSDLAKQIMKEESGNVPMQDYIMNSEGYTQHYERKVPSAYKKIIKQNLGVEPKVESGPLREKKIAMEEYYKKDLLEYLDLLDQLVEENRDNESIARFGVSFDRLTDEQQYELEMRLRANLLKDIEKRIHGKQGPHGTTIHITPEMKAAYKKIKQEKGAVFPGYKKGGSIKSAIELARNLNKTGAV